MNPVQPERRRHKRYPLPCPVRLAVDAGGPPLAARTVDISDGGAMVPVPAGASPPAGTRLTFAFSLPRSTPNTFLLEDFSTPAEVVRREPARRKGLLNLAVRFETPLDLQIEV